MLSLTLFKAVLKKNGSNIIVNFDEGYILPSGAGWANAQVRDHFKQNRLKGSSLNKTFYETWSDITNRDDHELMHDAILHYASTYGAGWTGTVFMPNEVVGEDTTLPFIVIAALTRDELVEKALGLLASGMAMQQETVQNVIDFLTRDLKYQFTGNEVVKNKEAAVLLADLFEISPSDPVEALRYVVYKATDSTLLIKNHAVIEKLKTDGSAAQPDKVFKACGVDKMATIFNRFKPLFLALKDHSKLINRISKLSKKLHEPMPVNPLSLATSRAFSASDDLWLANATTWRLLAALGACYQVGWIDTALIRIRNGKSWVATRKSSELQQEIADENYESIMQELSRRIGDTKKSVYIPDNVDYALPTSEKMFVGNIPEGTRITGKTLTAGMYWEDDWGARDLDLTALSSSGSIRWGRGYYSDNHSMVYSGDITSAHNGAVEYMKISQGVTPSFLSVNIFSGEVGCEFKLIVGDGKKIPQEQKMKSEAVMVDEKIKTCKRQTIIGMAMPEDEGVSFTVMNFGADSRHVTDTSERANQLRNALEQRCVFRLPLKKVLEELNMELTSQRDDATIDLSLENISKESFVELFS